MKQFKRLSYLLVAILCFASVSCSSSSSDPSFEEDAILGGWTITHIDSYWYENGRKVTQSTEYKPGDWIFRFDENGEGFSWSSDDGWIDFHWRLKNGNQLVLNSSGDTETFKVVRLNASGGILEQEGTDEDNREYYVKLTLKKYNIPS